MYLIINYRYDFLLFNIFLYIQYIFFLFRFYVFIVQVKIGDGIIDCNGLGKVLLDFKKECINFVLNLYIYILCFKYDIKNIYKYLIMLQWCGKYEIKKNNILK